jgi:1-deoxy-D-xylulose-5-phosphate reductoisomerase
MTMQNIVVLGSTGSIGVSTLDVVARHPDRFQVLALSAHTQIDLLLAQCRQFRPRFAVMSDVTAADTFRTKVKQAGLACEVLGGVEALCQVASLTDAQTVMAAIVGAAGLRPTLAAAMAGKKLLLANKESLVMAGPLFMRAVRDHGARLLPIDSEHNAIFQALPSGLDGSLAKAGVRRLMLTASGGPFRDRSRDSLDKVTPEQACAHPNWVMGRKISVDSATMMNKGLEVIEARWLFDARPEQIEVVIHRQSVVHSLVEYVDGSVLAQLGNPDMRTPIAYALAYPERIESGARALDLFEIGKLEFERPDYQRFPCLPLAFEALRAGDWAAVALNAANEVAVARFLDGRLPFTRIAQLIEDVLARAERNAMNSIEEIVAADARARALAGDWLQTAVH